MKEEIPEDAFVHSIRPTREICLSIQITLASSQNNFIKLDMLLDLSTNATFIDKAWAEKCLCPYATQYLCITLMERGTPLEVLPMQWS